VNKAAPAGPPPPLVRELIFNTNDPRWSGDLGRFLLEKVKEGDRCVRVWVSGKGSFVSTPYRAPEKTSLEILADLRPSTAGGPLWSVSPTAPANSASMLEVRGGDLVLSGVQISCPPSAKSRSLLQVEDGHLFLRACRLSSSGHAANGSEALVRFRAVGTKRLVAKDCPGPFEGPVDRPVFRAVDSVLIADGGAIAAEIGRGLIALSHCALISSGTALGLLPARVARGRFEADLLLDHCSLAAEKNFVQVGAWPGQPPGPERPWLISTLDCAFLASYQPPSRESVLLRFVPTALSMGVPFWQGSGDAYEVVNFAARTDAPPPANAFPDVRRQWVSLWGANHFRSVTGPSRSSGWSVRTISRLRPGHTEAADLKLDPDNHPGRSTLAIGADLSRLPAPPLAARAERPR
jgi:serine/threonine-protein kinase